MMKRNTAKILTDLRALMRQLPNNGGSINAYIIPTDDRHQSEYISSTDERRSFISGFDGSAGTAVVTLNEALLWTDGRYHQQAEQQIDENWTLMKGFEYQITNQTKNCTVDSKHILYLILIISRWFTCNAYLE